MRFAVQALGPCGVELRGHDHRVHEHDALEGIRTLRRSYGHAVATHGMSCADRALDSERVDEADQVLAEAIPGDGLRVLAQAMTAHVHGDHAIARESLDNGIPAAAMKARRMHEEDGLSVGAHRRPFCVGERQARGKRDPGFDGVRHGECL